MKKITLACTLLIALMASAFAGPVDSTYAKKMANNFWQANIAPMRGEQNEPQFRNLAPQMALNHLYIWQNASGEGFVIMSADDWAH
ncbi:MAG: Spi family protease inhibitor, partial [Bacteroidales bacterium]|nr:Spi family protease inhibitor [Bacteroidales bacterium]